MDDNFLWDNFFEEHVDPEHAKILNVFMPLCWLLVMYNS